MRAALALVVCLAGLSGQAKGQMRAELHPETVAAFDDYVREAEAGMRLRTTGAKPFLRIDEKPGAAAKVRSGELLVKRLLPSRAKAPNGLLHDWVGAMFVPGARAKDLIGLFQDVKRQQSVYSEVLRAELISRSPGVMRSRRLVRKKKVLTVVLDLDLESFYENPGPGRYYIRAYSRRINQIENYGEPDQRRLPAGDDMGLMWRLNSYWRLREADRGVYAELRTISLSRAIPAGLGWIVKPLIRDVPADSLRAVLRQTRAAVAR